MIYEIITYGELLYTKIAERWFSSPFLNNLFKIVVGFLIGVFTDIHVYLVCIVILVFMDVITGIAASLKEGNRFMSKKIKWGLLERFILYGSLIIITLAIDSIIRGTWDYGTYYITVFCCTIIGFYEAGSCVENLITIFPNYTFLKKIANVLNLLEKTYEKNTVEKVSDVLKQKGEDEKV